MPYLTIDDYSIFYELSHKALDNNLPIIAIFPGGPGFSHDLYKKQAQFLKDQYQVLMFDPLGSGKSTTLLPIKYSFNNFSYIFSRLQKHIGCKKIVIIGTSYGSMAALHYAINYPQSVESLICIAGSPSYHFINKAKKNVLTLGTDEQIAICDEFLWDGQFKTHCQFIRYMETLTPLYALSAKKIEKEKQPYRSVKCNLDDLNYAFASNFENFDFRKNLSSIHQHVLWLAGENDWINDPQLISPYVATMPACEFHSIPNCGHSVFSDQPKLYEDYILNFLNQHIYPAK